MLKPFSKFNGIAGMLCPSAVSAVKSFVFVNSFSRLKRGKIILFQTSFTPQSCFSLSVIFPVQVIRFFEVASSSYSPFSCFLRSAVFADLSAAPADPQRSLYAVSPVLTLTRRCFH